MTKLIQLDAYRRPETPCCPRHALDDLATRIRERIDRAGSMLMPLTELEDVLADLKTTSDLILEPVDERSGR